MTDTRTMLHAILGCGDPAEQGRILGRIVVDLLLEVEALRGAVMELSARSGPRDSGEEAEIGSPHGLPGPRDPYAEAYAETAYLTHNAAGPSSGCEKLLWQYYSRGQEATEWRECLMLKRLGFTDADIAAYKERASGAEMMT